MKPIVKVVCGIIQKDGKYFIARRKQGKPLGGFWEFPGGKLEEGEDPKEALKRELFEELGMKVEDVKFFGRHKHEYESFIIDLLAYHCAFNSANFEMTDHDEYGFIKKDDILECNMAPADIYFVNMLL